MKKIRTLLVILAFMGSIGGAIGAKMNASPTDMWTKDVVTGECLQICSSTWSQNLCYNYAYWTLEDCILEHHPIISFRPF